MATRQEIFQRKQELKRTLRARCLEGELQPGSLAPSKRQLTAEFNVSSSVVTQVMRELIDEQLFYTVPRSGTFVGTPRPSRRYGFVFLSEAPPVFATTQLVRSGMESRIATLGGSVFTLYPYQVDTFLVQDSLPPIVGVMDWGHRLQIEKYPVLSATPPSAVCFAMSDEEAGGRDNVAFDDIDGGRQAAEHLIAQGHRRIAFLGLHEKESHALSEPEWSRLREQGWRQALENAGVFDPRLAFYADRPVHRSSPEDQEKSAHDTARRLMAHLDIDAVVVTNDHATRALLNEFRKGGLAPSHWPAIVSFDDVPTQQEEIVSSMRLPWEDIGKVAADLLWERSRGQAPPEPQRRLVKMCLIPRLSCQPKWMNTAPHIVPATRMPAPAAS